MKIMVSACLLGVNCKYSGGNNYSENLARLLVDQQVIPVCPELLGGLSCPRSPAEIVGGVVTNKEGKSVDYAFRQGAELALDLARKEEVELVVLQSRSPSCGVKEIYDGTFTGRLIAGQGIFVQLLQQAGIPVKDVEEVEANQSL